MITKYICSATNPSYRSNENWGGKSGQHRATHRLMAGPRLIGER